MLLCEQNLWWNKMYMSCPDKDTFPVSTRLTVYLSVLSIALSCPVIAIFE